MSEETKVIPKPKPMTEYGDTGLKRQSGFIFEEFLRELKNERAICVYKEMSQNDALVGAILYAINMVIRNVDWRIDAASTEKADLEASEFLWECMHDMEHTWDGFIDEALSMLVYGWSYHEIVYKRRLGMSKDKTKNSKYSDGRIGWRKLPIRSQDSWSEWTFEENGDLLAMTQLAPSDYTYRTIPVSKALHFRTSGHKNNPEGKSLLRTAYRSYYMKTRIENIEGIGVERDLAGLPMFWVPAEIMAEDASDSDKALLRHYKQTIKNIKRDEQEGLIMPLALDENGNKMYDFELVSTGSRRQFDTNAIIGRYDRNIAMSVLADFILLGHEKVGSFALSSSKTDIFALSVGAILENLKAVINSKAVPQLFALNGIKVDKLPIIETGDIETQDIDMLGRFIQTASAAGMELFPDNDLENHVRRQVGFPEKKDEE